MRLGYINRDTWCARRARIALGAAAVAAALWVVPATAPAGTRDEAVAAGVLAGTGSGSGGGCLAGQTNVVPFTGTSEAGGRWTFVASLARWGGQSGPACVAAMPGFFRGAWTPSGGCVDEAGIGRFCLGNVRPGSSSAVPFEICITAAGCVTGTANVVSVQAAAS